jgi:Sulfotransferase family
MLRDQAILSWFKPSFANLDSEFPNPFFGVETEEDRDLWPSLSLAGKSALRWRGAVRLAARLRRTLPAEQLITVRYETLLERPADTASAISAFAGLSLPAASLRDPQLPASMRAGSWRRTLTPDQAADVEKVAGDELRRVGYALSGAIR